MVALRACRRGLDDNGIYMLRLNVAPDQFATGRWVVHLFAGDGDEHIYQIVAGSATAAARSAMDSYDARLTNSVQLTTILMKNPCYEVGVTCIATSDDYPTQTRYVFSVED